MKKSHGKLASLLLMLPLLINCGSTGLNKKEKESLNSSALYDPPSITLIEDKEYQFEEGVVKGRGQKFISTYEYVKKSMANEEK